MSRTYWFVRGRIPRRRFMRYGDERRAVRGGKEGDCRDRSRSRAGREEEEEEKKGVGSYCTNTA